MIAYWWQMTAHDEQMCLFMYVPCLLAKMFNSAWTFIVFPPPPMVTIYAELDISKFFRRRYSVFLELISTCDMHLKQIVFADKSWKMANLPIVPEMMQISRGIEGTCLYAQYSLASPVLPGNCRQIVLFCTGHLHLRHAFIFIKQLPFWCDMDINLVEFRKSQFIRLKNPPGRASNILVRQYILSVRYQNDLQIAAIKSLIKTTACQRCWCWCNPMLHRGSYWFILVFRNISTWRAIAANTWPIYAFCQWFEASRLLRSHSGAAASIRLHLHHSYPTAAFPAAWQCLMVNSDKTWLAASAHSKEVEDCAVSH